MRVQIGQPVYFIKGFQDTPTETNLVKKEGTFYFQPTYPQQMTDQVIKGVVTARRGDISIPYYNMFLTFTKMDMWGSNVPPNKQQDYTPSIVYTAKSEARGKLVFDTIQEASSAYLKLQENGIYCTVRGNVIENIDRLTKARMIIGDTAKADRVLKIDDELEQMSYMREKEIPNDKIIL